MAKGSDTLVKGLKVDLAGLIELAKKLKLNLGSVAPPEELSQDLQGLHGKLIKLGVESEAAMRSIEQQAKKTKESFTEEEGTIEQLSAELKIMKDAMNKVTLANGSNKESLKLLNDEIAKNLALLDKQKLKGKAEVSQDNSIKSMDSMDDSLRKKALASMDSDYKKMDSMDAEYSAKHNARAKKTFEDKQKLLGKSQVAYDNSVKATDKMDDASNKQYATKRLQIAKDTLKTLKRGSKEYYAYKKKLATNEINDLKISAAKKKALTVTAMKNINAEQALFNKKLKESKERAGLLGGSFGSILSKLKNISVIGFAISAMVGTAIRLTGKFGEVDDAIAGVRKTTDMTAVAADKLTKSINGMETRTTLLDLLAMAETAGRLNIANKDILGFVGSMNLMKVALGDDIDMDTKQLTLTMVRLADAFKELKDNSPSEKILKLSSAINKLDNSTKATANEMVTYLKGVVGMISGYKLHTDSMLAMAGAVSQSGLAMNQASTATARVVKKMGEDIETFAKVSGMSIEELTSAFIKDPIVAMARFSKGLTTVQDDAIKMSIALDDIQLSGRRTSETILAVADNYDAFSENMGTVNEELNSQISVLEEAALMESTLAGTTEGLANDWKELYSNRDIIEGMQDMLKGIKDITSAHIEQRKEFSDRLKPRVLIDGKFVEASEAEDSSEPKEDFSKYASRAKSLADEIDAIKVAYPTVENYDTTVNQVKRLNNLTGVATFLYEKLSGSSKGYKDEIRLLLDAVDGLDIKQRSLNKALAETKTAYDSKVAREQTLQMDKLNLSLETAIATSRNAETLSRRLQMVKNSATGLALSHKILDTEWTAFMKKVKNTTFVDHATNSMNKMNAALAAQQRILRETSDDGTPISKIEKKAKTLHALLEKYKDSYSDSDYSTMYAAINLKMMNATDKVIKDETDKMSKANNAKLEKRRDFLMKYQQMFAEDNSAETLKLKLAEEIQVIKDAAEELGLTDDEVTSLTEGLTDYYDKDIADSLTDAEKAGVKFTDSLASGIAQSIVQAKSLEDVLTSIIKQLAASVLTGFLSSLFNPVGVALGGLFSVSTAQPLIPPVNPIAGNMNEQFATLTKAVGNITSAVNDKPIFNFVNPVDNRYSEDLNKVNTIGAYKNRGF